MPMVRRRRLQRTSKVRSSMTSVVIISRLWKQLPAHKASARGQRRRIPPGRPRPLPIGGSSWRRVGNEMSV